jgi:hypothetical protein
MLGGNNPVRLALGAVTDHVFLLPATRSRLVSAYSRPQGGPDVRPRREIRMLKVTAVTALVLGLGVDPTLADQLLWARKSTFGGLTAISIAEDGSLYCTGCNSDNSGPIPIQRGLGVDADVVSLLDPWISSLWVVLFRVDKGNHCEGDYYTISLNTHNLEQINTSRFGCASLNISMTEKELGMEITFTDELGHREVREVQ